MDESKVRAFLAVELDSSVRLQLEAFVHKIQPRFPKFRFLRSDNWHITLHFFGALTPVQITEIINHLETPISQIQSFQVSLQGLGRFPEGKKSRIFWVGISEGADRFVSVKKTLDSILEEMKFPIEGRLFHPHITIGRAKEPTSCQFTEEDQHFNFGPSFEVRQITLMKSTLDPKGAIYTPLHQFFLAKSS